MKATGTALLGVLLLFAPAAWGKGVTTRITIEDVSRGTSIDITDPKTLDGFQVWAGRGTFRNGVEGRDGFIIEWSAGVVVDRPPALRQYQVRFYARRPTAPSEQLVYVVLYEDDPSSGQGFVYLSGQSDQHYRLNASSIHRGHDIEGNWFRATAAWQKVIRPSINSTRFR